MCGSLIGPRTIGSADLDDFLVFYASGSESHCHHCVRRMRKFTRFASRFRDFDRIRARNLGLE